MFFVKSFGGENYFISLQPLLRKGFDKRIKRESFLKLLKIKCFSKGKRIYICSRLTGKRKENEVKLKSFFKILQIKCFSKGKRIYLCSPKIGEKVHKICTRVQFYDLLRSRVVTRELRFKRRLLFLSTKREVRNKFRDSSLKEMSSKIRKKFR